MSTFMRSRVHTYGLLICLLAVFGCGKEDASRRRQQRKPATTPSPEPTPQKPPASPTRAISRSDKPKDDGPESLPEAMARLRDVLKKISEEGRKHYAKEVNR